jgi:UDP-N-acetylmuramoyl-L-alanyl-D-glutamate--2,6-diaminopimelate ligase
VKLGALVSRLSGARLVGDGMTTVLGVTHDSRMVRPGWVFAALPGRNAHGLDFLAGALANGAAAVLTDRPRPTDVKAAWITTSAPRKTMAEAALAVSGDPQRELVMVGVTGTNGKSTTAHLLHHIFSAAGMPSAFLGTLGYFLPDGQKIAAERTTPESSDLAVILRATVDAGGKAVAMEASSHGLMQNRLAGLEFQAAVWTNLSRDHLDYHGDMESYYRAKRRLFDKHLAADGRRVLPVDDPWGARLLDDARPGDLSWGLVRGDVHATHVEKGLDGTRLELHLPGSARRVYFRPIGTHNLRNALAAAGGAHAAGVTEDAIVRGLEQARPLTGRLETVEADLPFPVMVDFAHTPDGLRAVLQSLRKLTDRRLIVVFGAGGDKDKGKRGPMGFAVGELADLAVVTSDNPRSEDPTAIAEAVAEGVRAAGSSPRVILDRRQAIGHALESADSSSLVLVAGKGHEDLQTIGDEQIPFFDQQVILELARGVPCG